MSTVLQKKHIIEILFHNQIQMSNDESNVFFSAKFPNTTELFMQEV